MQEFAKLLKERFGEIIILSVSQRVPFVSPPNIPVVYHQIGLRRKHCNNRLAGKCAFIMIECPFIAPNKSPDNPALRAECRRWDLDFFIKIKILQFNYEIFFAILTDFRFSFHHWIIRLIGLFSKKFTNSYLCNTDHNTNASSLWNYKTF